MKIITRIVSIIVKFVVLKIPLWIPMNYSTVDAKGSVLIQQEEVVIEKIITIPYQDQSAHIPKECELKI